jgi:hypothetical protein
MSRSRIVENRPSRLVLGPARTGSIPRVAVTAAGLAVLAAAFVLWLAAPKALGVGALILGLFGLLLSISAWLVFKRRRTVELDVDEQRLTFYGSRSGDVHQVALGDIQTFRLRNDRHNDPSGSPLPTGDTWLCELEKHDGTAEIIDEGRKDHILGVAELLAEKTGLPLEDRTGSGLSRPAARSYRAGSSKPFTAAPPANSVIHEDYDSMGHFYSWPKSLGPALNLLLLGTDLLFAGLFVYLVVLLSRGKIPVPLFAVAGGVLLVLLWAITKGLLVSNFGRDAIRVNHAELTHWVQLFGARIKERRFRSAEIHIIRLQTNPQGLSSLELETRDGHRYAVAQISTSHSPLTIADLHWLENKLGDVLNVPERA